MITWLLILLVLASSVSGFGREWNLDRNRAYWFFLCLGILVIWTLPNLWLQALLAIILIRFGLGGQPLERIKRIDDTVLIAAVAALLIPVLTDFSVIALLWTITVIGTWVLIWSLVSLWKFDSVEGYALSVPVTKWWHLRFFEYSSHIAGGQGNPNHLHGVSVVAVSASIGLGILGQPIGYWIAPVLAIPVAISQFVRTENPGHWKRPQQGWAHLLVLGLAWVPIWLGPWGWAGLFTLAVATVVALVVNRNTDTGIDSGRGKLWWAMVKEWWSGPRLDHFIGWGAKEFEQRYINKVARDAQQTGHFVVAHHPHSEYVCCLVENGVFGLALLSGYLVTTLFGLLHAGPEGLALYGVGVVLCSVAFISFPWTFYHEILFRFELAQGSTANGPQNQSKLFTLGSPSLFAISFAMLVVVEALLGRY